MPGLQPTIDQARRARQVQGGLGNVVLRIGANFCGELRPFRGARVGTHQHAVSAGLPHRLDHQFIKVLQRVAQSIGLAAKVRLHVADDGLLIEIVADHGRHVGINGLVVSHARARCVRHGEIARAVHLEQPRHP